MLDLIWLDPSAQGLNSLAILSFILKRPQSSSHYGMNYLCRCVLSLTNTRNDTFPVLMARDRQTSWGVTHWGWSWKRKTRSEVAEVAQLPKRVDLLSQLSPSFFALILWVLQNLTTGLSSTARAGYILYNLQTWRIIVIVFWSILLIPFLMNIKHNVSNSMPIGMESNKIG